ncbi:MAG: metal-dependent transcriptional regulator, partial [Actinomycetota bacterium]
MATPGEHHPAFEEYCECIFELREDNVEIIQARLVERLNVSRPSVSEMIKRMEAEGLVSIRGQKITLTHKGDQLAERVVRRHRLAERFLTDVLKLSWSQAHHEACKWEHVISADVERAQRAEELLDLVASATKNLVEELATGNVAVVCPAALADAESRALTTAGLDHGRAGASALDSSLP